MSNDSGQKMAVTIALLQFGRSGFSRHAFTQYQVRMNSEMISAPAIALKFDRDNML